MLFKAEDQEIPQWYYFDSQNWEGKSPLIYFYSLNSMIELPLKVVFKKKWTLFQTW